MSEPSPSLRLDPSTSRFIDAARWISALVVVVCHVCTHLLTDHGRIEDPSAGLRVLFALYNLGHLAVIVFFVLSGYLVGGQGLLRLMNGGGFDLRRYAVQRIARLYTVFLPALLATLAFDYLGQRYFDAQALYARFYWTADRASLSAFLGNLAMLQTVVVGPFGSDGPLWSLANEFWYYVVFALVLVGLSRGRAAPVRIAAGAAGACLLVLLPRDITWWFAIWLAGVGVAVLSRHLAGWRFGPSLVFMAVCFGVVLWGIGLRSSSLAVQWALDAVAALGFAAPLLSARRLAPGAGELHRRLADVSYTLYLVHFPVLVFMASFANAVFGLPLWQRPNVGAIGLVIVFTAVLCGWAWVFAQLTERHTPRVRRALMELTSLRPRVAALPRTALDRR